MLNFWNSEPVSMKSIPNDILEQITKLIFANKDHL
jgi:hypothetical protein